MPGSTLASCQTVISGVTNNSPTCTVSSITPIVVTISGSSVFTTDYSAVGTSFFVTMSGLINPTSLISTGSFSVKTMDSLNN